ncbi:MAG: hypothetical protein JRG89_09150, partial [Deltaproteobacteria bacterium]|nr:hypothetical protein [Deltaproteobacteria bacterium]
LAHENPRLCVFLIVHACLVFGGVLSAPRLAHAETFDLEQVLGASLRDRSGGTLRIEGSLQVCARNGGFELQISTDAATEQADCTAYPVQYLHEEGNPPWVDLQIDGESFTAQQVHLFQRGVRWYVLVEGHHGSSVTREHRGAVFRVITWRRLGRHALVRVCSAFITASDEQNPVLHRCIGETLDKADTHLVVWLEGDACLIDYSACRTTETANDDLPSASKGQAE